MLHLFLGMLAGLAALIVSTSATWAQARLALVIGNSAYTKNTPLNNPANDAQAVAQVLNTAGFEVVMAFDLSRDLMKQTIEEFAARVGEKGPDSSVLVYYAGHGLQVDGENYLMPVDVELGEENDVADQGIKLAELMGALEAVPSKVRIVILDACRNNPFSASGEVGGRGLAIVDAPAGSIVAYSTAPGTEAFDGTGRHSPYAAAFMRTVKQPNMPIEQVFKRVRLLVNESTDSKQTPWESSSLTTDFFFFANANANVAPPVVPAKVAIADLRTRPVRDAYEIVIAEDSVEYYEEFVRLYPADPLCNHIRRQLSRRQQMIAWQAVTHRNSPQDYASFVTRFGDSDLGRAARRLQERPRVVNIAFPQRGEGRFGDGRFGSGRINIGNIGRDRPVISFPQNNRDNNVGRPGNNNQQQNNQNQNSQGNQNNQGRITGLPQGNNPGNNANSGGGRNPVIPFQRGQDNKGTDNRGQNNKPQDGNNKDQAGSGTNLPKNAGINPNTRPPNNQVNQNTRPQVDQNRNQNRGNEGQNRQQNQQRASLPQRVQQPQRVQPPQRVQQQQRPVIQRQQAQRQAQPQRQTQQRQQVQQQRGRGSGNNQVR